MVTTDKVYRKYSTILPCAAAINLFPFLKQRRLVETYECSNKCRLLFWLCPEFKAGRLIKASNHLALSCAAPAHLLLLLICCSRSCTAPPSHNLSCSAPPPSRYRDFFLNRLNNFYQILFFAKQFLRPNFFLTKPISTKILEKI